MSLPPRSSHTEAPTSQSNTHVNAPTVLSQHLPAPFPSPNGTHSFSQGTPTSSEARGSLPFSTANGNPSPDGHQHPHPPRREGAHKANHLASAPAMNSESRGSHHKRSRQSSMSQHREAPTSPKADGHPSVLLREKKQKACSNCRRAKLQCIVEGGDTDCVRCKNRKERCIFYPKSHVCSTGPLSRLLHSG